MDKIRLNLLGGLEVQVGPGTVLRIPVRKAAALFAYLALNPGRLKAREQLASLFWDSSTDAQARASLRQALALLRRSVPGIGGALHAMGDAVALQPGWASTDVAAFEAAASEPELLTQAASLYQGELMAGLHLPCTRFEVWLLPERSRLHDRAITAMRALLEQNVGDMHKRIMLALRLLQLDPAQEEVHRALIRLYARCGQHEMAMRQFQACREALRRELDIAPASETLELFRDIQARRVAVDVRPALISRLPTSLEHRFVTITQIELDAAGRLRHDPEALQQAQEALFRAVRQAAILHGGVASTGFGLTAMMVFGWPFARADDAGRGVRAALEVHALLAQANSVRIGVACGHVMVGDTSLNDGLPLLAGEVMDQARRLAAQAHTGEITVASPIRDVVADYDWEVIGGGPDGFAWRWCGPALKESTVSLPFVGRRAELGQFTAVLVDLLESGFGRVIAVRGEAGLGKTRLIEEFRRAAATAGLCCHLAKFMDSGVVDPNGVMRTLFYSLLGCSMDDHSIAAAIDRIVEAGWIAKHDCGVLHDLLGLQVSLTAKRSMNSADQATYDGTRREVIGAVVRAASAQAPRLLLVEDTHLADAQALADLAAAAAVAPMSQVLLITTSQRPYSIAAAIAPAVTLDLAPLRLDEANALAGHLRNDTDPAVRDCLDRAGGNPSFIIELLRGAGREDGSLPATVHSAVLVRLDALDPQDRLALQAASVLGRQFAQAALQHMLDQPDYVCTQLVLQALLRPCRDGYLFVHALVRDAIYASLPRTLQCRWHLRAAEWFVKRDLRLHAQHLSYAGEDRQTAPSAYSAVTDLTLIFRKRCSAAIVPG